MQRASRWSSRNHLFRPGNESAERRSGADSHRRLSRFRLANQRIAHLEQLDRLFGPQPGRQAKPVVLVEDNGPIHRSVGTCAAGAATQGACRPSG